MRLLLKAAGIPRKIAGQAGYVKIKGRWHKISHETKVPKGAPKAAHPEAAGKHTPYHMPDEHLSQVKYAPEKAASNHEMKNFNEKHVPALVEHAKAGDATAILGHQYGTNTHAKKLVALANHLLANMGSKHQVQPGQKAGEHEAVASFTQPVTEKQAEAVAEQAQDEAATELKKPVAGPDEKPAKSETPAPAAGPLTMPSFLSGKMTKGVRTAYEQQAEKLIDAANAGDVQGVQALVNPNAGSWKGKTANSKMLLNLYAQALSHAQKITGGRAAPVSDTPSPVAAVEVVATTPAKPTPAAKPEPGAVEAIEWDKYKTPDTIKSSKGYNKQLEAVKQAALAGDVYGLLAAKYGTNTYAKKVAAAANLALAALGHPHLKVLLGKDKVHPALGALTPAEEDQQDQMQTHEKVAAAREQGPKNGDTRVGKNGQMQVLKNGRWHNVETGEEVPEKEQAPQPLKAGGQVTPSQMKDLPAGSIIQLYTKDGKPGQKFLIGHDNAWFIGANGKPHKNPVGKKQYLGLMGVEGVYISDDYAGGYHAKAHPTTIDKLGRGEGWLSKTQQAVIKTTFLGAESLFTSPGVYPMFGGQFVAIADPAHAGKGYWVNEKGDYGMLTMLNGAHQDPTWTKLMKGEDPGNNLAPQLGLGKQATAEAGKHPTHSDPGVDSLMDSVASSLDGEQYQMADHFIALAAEALQGMKASEENLKAMEWLVAMKEQVHQHAPQPRSTVPEAPAPTIEPQKMTPLPSFDSPEGKAYDEWVDKLNASKEPPAEAPTAPAKPTVPDTSGLTATWADMVKDAAAALDKGAKESLISLKQMTDGLTAEGAMVGNTFATEALDWLDSQEEKPSKYTLAINALQGNVDDFESEAEKLAISMGDTPESWKVAAGALYAVGKTYLTKTLTYQAMMKFGKGGLPDVPEGISVGVKDEIEEAQAAALYLPKEFALESLKKQIYFLHGLEMGITKPAINYIQGLETQLGGEPTTLPDKPAPEPAPAPEKEPEPKPEPAAPVAAGEEGPHEGDMKMSEAGTLLVLKNGHWVKAGPDNVPMPEYQEGSAYYKLANALKEDFTKHGKKALKEGEVTIVSHKNGAYSLKYKGISGKKLTADSYTPNIASLVKYIDTLKASVGLKVVNPIKGIEGVTAPKPKPKRPVVQKNVQTGPKAIDSWNQTGPQQGANPGGVFTDEHGQQWYVKFPHDEEQARAEVMAARLYEVMGVAGQQARLVTRDGKLGIASKWVDNLTQASPSELAAAPGVLENFAADAWLANWDVVGTGYDNLKLDGKGNAVRVDAGGSLMYKATGGKKPFTEEVPELETMRDPSVNKYAASVFGKMSEADLVASVAKLATVTDNTIRQVVQSSRPGSVAERKALAELLIARKHNIVKQFPQLHEKQAAKTRFKIENLVQPPDFFHWSSKGGQPLSSKEWQNKGNQEAVDAVYTAAQTGDLDTLNTIQAPVFNPQGGIDHLVPLVQHPSSHVKTYWMNTKMAVEYQLKGGEVGYDIGQVVMGDDLTDILDKMKPVEAGEGVALVPAVQKVGLYILQGKIGNAEQFVPAKDNAVIGSAEWKAQAKSVWNNASSAAKASFQTYLSTSGCRALNTALREGNLDKMVGNKSVRQHIKDMDELMMEVPEGSTFVRSMGTKGYGTTPNEAWIIELQQFLLNAEQGTTIQEPGYSSSSWTGGNMTLSGNDIQWNFTAGKGVKLFPGWLSANQSEGEALLPPNTRYVILGASMDKNGKTVNVDAVLLPAEGYLS